MERNNNWKVKKDKKFKDSKSYICMKNRIGPEGKKKLKAEDFI